MRAFGHYLLSSRLHAIGLVSLTAIISFYLSSIFIALAVMRRGGKFGIQVIAGGLCLVVLAVSLIQKMAVTEALVNVLQAWLPVWCCAMVLRKTESQAMMTMVAGAFGALFVILIYVLVDDVPVWWQTWFNDLFDLVIASNMSGEATDRFERLRADLALIAPMINPLIISFLVIRLITVVLIGRWWQGHLYTESELEAAMKEAGFVNVAFRRVPLPIPVPGPVGSRRGGLMTRRYLKAGAKRRGPEGAGAPPQRLGPKGARGFVGGPLRRS